MTHITHIKSWYIKMRVVSQYINAVHPAMTIHNTNSISKTCKYYTMVIIRGCILCCKILKPTLATKSDNKNHDAPVGHNIKSFKNKTNSPFMKEIQLKSGLLVDFIHQSSRKPNIKNNKKGISNRFVDFLRRSLVDVSLCIIPPLKKNHDIKNDRVVPTNEIRAGFKRPEEDAI